MKKRIISQIGDSTDGEDQEELELNFRSVESNIEGNSEYVKKLNQYIPSSVYYSSYILKDIANRLLQSPEVREIYKGIKNNFVKKEKLYVLQPLDIQLGKGWGIIINGYNNEANRKLDKIAEDQLAEYYTLNKNMIDLACAGEEIYNSFKTEAERASYYLKEKVKIKDQFKEIYKLNKEIEQYAESKRDIIELFPNEIDVQENAKLFLAKIKASKKLDKDLGKNYLYDYKYGTGKTIGDNSVAKKTTQKDETLEIYTVGGFRHHTTDEASYSNIGTRLKEYIDNEFIDQNKLKQFLQDSIRGQINGDIVLDGELKVDLINQLQTLVKLMFSVEVKRNTSALLTNAMFFDLVDAKIYEIKDIAKEIPVAMEDAVPASVTIDKKVSKYFTSITGYDYRETEAKSKAEILAKRDDKILIDWLLYKLKLNINERINSLNSDSTVKDFEKLGFNTNIENKEEKINNKEMLFELDTNKINLKLQWYTPVSGNAKFRINLCNVHEINVKVFYELINEWYAIKIPYLNGTIKLKAAGEKKDDINPQFKPHPTNIKDKIIEILKINESKMFIEEPEINPKQLLNKPHADSFLMLGKRKGIGVSIADKVLKILTNNELYTQEDFRSVLNPIYNHMVNNDLLIDNKITLAIKEILLSDSDLSTSLNLKKDLAEIFESVEYNATQKKVLKGSGKYGEEKDIGYINSYFGKYTLDGLDHILHLRIEDLQLKDIKILQAMFVNKNHNNIADLLAQISNSTDKTTLVPLNLFDKHAIGLIFIKDKDHTIQIKYLDSLNKAIPEELKRLITTNTEIKVELEQITVAQQQYANCAPEVIENFILYLTGKRVSQEKAVELHSKLVENSLLDLTIPNTCLLFEQSNYDKFQPDIFLSGNHNEELSTFL